VIPLSSYLIVAALLFGLSLAGLIVNRRYVITLLMCLELMLLAVNINFVAFSHFMHDIAGQVFVFFILTVAAAEAAIGLALIVVLHRRRNTTEIDKLNYLKG
jgi:NADH-quinone oxidoreductase subunit K